MTERSVYQIVDKEKLVDKYDCPEDAKYLANVGGRNSFEIMLLNDSLSVLGSITLSFTAFKRLRKQGDIEKTDEKARV